MIICTGIQTGPGKSKNHRTYMRHEVNKLLILNKGIPAFDAATDQNFTLHARVIATLGDYPGKTLYVQSIICSHYVHYMCTLNAHHHNICCTMMCLLLTPAQQEKHGINGGSGSAKCSCMKCTMTASYSPCLQKQVQKLAMSELRTQKQYEQDAKNAERMGEETNGVHYRSEWEKLPNFRVLTCALLDPMHCAARPLAMFVELISGGRTKKVTSSVLKSANQGVIASIEEYNQALSVLIISPARREAINKVLHPQPTHSHQGYDVVVAQYYGNTCISENVCIICAQCVHYMCTICSHVT